jgi:hypothetical protein
VQAKFILPFLGLGLVLQACAPKAPPPPPPAPPPPPPPHIGPPQAASCLVVPFHVSDGGTVPVTMRVSNEGGYCAATLTADSGKPYDAPLVPVLPHHGTPRVVKYDGKTSVEYSADAGYVGPDNFEVHLIVKGNPAYTTLNVSVTVEGPARN